MPSSRVIAALILLLALSGAAAAEPPGERRSVLIHRLKHDCGSCHGLTLKGGLGPSLLPSALRGKPEEALVEVILRGVPGTPMPPWRGELSEDEAAWLVGLLKRGVPQ